MFEDIDQKLIKKMKEKMNTDEFTQEELNKFFDKKVKLPKRNKLGEELYLYRHTSSQPIAPGSSFFTNKADYYVINQEGMPSGKLTATVANSMKGNDLEIEYLQQYDESKNKGNMSIALEGVVKDIFLSKPLDGLPIRKGVVSNIQRIFLAINENNIFSQRVAEKTGFTKTNSDTYELTLSQYLAKMRETEELDEGR